MRACGLRVCSLEQHVQLSHDKIFAYVKARVSVPDDDVVVLSGDEIVLERAFVGELLVMLVYDHGNYFELLNRGHLAALGTSEDALFNLGISNLEAFLDARRVTAGATGVGLAIFAGGDFEASMLLVPSMWTWVCENLRATRLLAAVPARDLLMVVDADDPRGRADLEDFVTHTKTLELDHRLTNEKLIWDGNCWAEHRVDDLP